MPTTQVKLVYQKDPAIKALVGEFACSLCSCCSAAYNWDRSVTMAFFAKNNWDSSYGLKSWTNVKCDGGKSMKVEWGNGASFTKLKAQLDRNLPAIIKLTGNGGTHYVCAYDYADTCKETKHVKVMDPAQSKGWTTLDDAAKYSSRPDFVDVGICSYFTA